MPQVEFHVPFTRCENPDLASARAHNLAWLEEFGLLVSESSRQQYLTADVADFCSMAHPHARAEDLNAVVDAWSWMVFPDDLFDGPAGRHTGLVALLCRRLAAIIEGWPDVAPDAANPMENALYEMWGRLIDTMPAWWIRHRTRLWSDYLIAHLSEAGTRSDGRPPAFKDYLRQRRLSIGCWPTLLVERTDQFHVPPAVLDHPLWQQLHELWIDAISHVNDVYSLEKDEAFGDDNNLVLVLEHERQLSRDQALRIVQEFVRAKTGQFRQLCETALKAGIYRPALTATERENVERYLTGMGHYAAANYYYSRHVKRYSSRGGTVEQRLSVVRHLEAHL